MSFRITTVEGICQTWSFGNDILMSYKKISYRNTVIMNDYSTDLYVIAFVYFVRHRCFTVRNKAKGFQLHFVECSRVVRRPSYTLCGEYFFTIVFEFLHIWYQNKKLYCGWCWHSSVWSLSSQFYLDYDKVGCITY